VALQALDPSAESGGPIAPNFQPLPAFAPTTGPNTQAYHTAQSRYGSLEIRLSLFFTEPSLLLPDFPRLGGATAPEPGWLNFWFTPQYAAQRPPLFSLPRLPPLSHCSCHLPSPVHGHLDRVLCFLQRVEPHHADDRDRPRAPAAPQAGPGFADRQPTVLDPPALGEGLEEHPPGGGCQKTSKLDPMSPCIMWGRGGGCFSSFQTKSPLKGMG